MLELDATSLDSIVRVIQVSLTPIFLLTAVASLLNVFTARLARISDQVHTLTDLAANAEQGALIQTRLSYLRRRSHILDIAVALGALAGATTCATALSLFLGLLRSKATVSFLFVLFGSALLCTIGALAAFLFEVLLASRGIRADVARHAEGLKR
jgi:fluoride ion exporter CrcB/FEX